MALLTARELQYPFTADAVRGLRIGDVVSLTGHLYAFRDRLHKYAFEGGRMPVPLKDGAIYHCGPVVVRREGGWIVRAAGPTSSIRAERYMPRIIKEHQVRVVIGKGGMGAGTRKACAECGCVYLQAVGGAGQMLASKIQRVEGTHFLAEFGPTEALWDFVVAGFPAVVTIDAHGRSLHQRVESASKSAFRRILSEGGPFRG